MATHTCHTLEHGLHHVSRAEANSSPYPQDCCPPGLKPEGSPTPILVPATGDQTGNQLASARGHWCGFSMTLLAWLGAKVGMGWAGWSTRQGEGTGYSREAQVRHTPEGMMTRLATQGRAPE